LADEVSVLESVQGGAGVGGAKEEELGFVPGCLERRVSGSFLNIPKIIAANV
jgi:hypothetical protein